MHPVFVGRVQLIADAGANVITTFVSRVQVRLVNSYSLINQ